ncbi:MAG: hypothetical protein Q613_PSC00300G0002, partial [Propionibacterium sp. DORA_15]
MSLGGQYVEQRVDAGREHHSADGGDDGNQGVGGS